MRKAIGMTIAEQLLPTSRIRHHLSLSRDLGALPQWTEQKQKYQASEAHQWRRTIWARAKPAQIVSGEGQANAGGNCNQREKLSDPKQVPA